MLKDATLSKVLEVTFTSAKKNSNLMSHATSKSLSSGTRWRLTSLKMASEPLCRHLTTPTCCFSQMHLKAQCVATQRYLIWEAKMSISFSERMTRYSLLN